MYLERFFFVAPFALVLTLPAQTPKSINVSQKPKIQSDANVPPILSREEQLQIRALRDEVQLIQVQMQPVQNEIQALATVIAAKYPGFTLDFQNARIVPIPPPTPATPPAPAGPPPPLPIPPVKK